MKSHLGIAAIVALASMGGTLTAAAEQPEKKPGEGRVVRPEPLPDSPRVAAEKRAKRKFKKLPKRLWR